MIVIILTTMTMSMTATVCFKGFSPRPNIYTGTKQSNMANSGTLSLLFLEQATADFDSTHSSFRKLVKSQPLPDLSMPLMAL